tara:strand:- start:339 stop:863 length:525 start_codon:yes stop_codon:yes gene_type:complete
MDYKIIKNFISREEQNDLVKWIMNNKDNTELFKDANMNGNRITTRYSKKFSFHDTAYVVQKRIIDKFKFKDFKLPEYNDGIVASYAGDKDTVYEHFDPQWYPPKETLHCNLMLQKPLEGGKPFINRVNINLDERDLWCYYVSKTAHGCSQTKGSKPRLMYVFGFCIDYEDLDIL